MQEKLRVWDLPTRLFHWALVACLVGSLVSINMGGNAVAWHFRFGYAILALLLFRLVWGFVGPHYARFSSFPPNPAQALRELRGRQPGERLGHSALGALSIYAMLLALAFQAGTGLFANDAIMWDGPLKNLVSNDTSDLLTRLHKINRFVVIGLVVLHLAAIAYYALVKRRRLVRPMLTGDLPVPPAEAAAHRPARDDLGLRVRGLILVAAAAAAVWGIVRIGVAATPGF